MKINTQLTITFDNSGTLLTVCGLVVGTRQVSRDGVFIGTVYDVEPADGDLVKYFDKHNAQARVRITGVGTRDVVKVEAVRG